MKRVELRSRRRATVLLMIVGLLAMLFILVSAYIVLARNDRQSLRLVAQSERVTQIMASLRDALEGAITDTDGDKSAAGTAYVDAPGLAGVTTGTNLPWGSPWLASPEAVLTPGVSATNVKPEDFTLPAVTAVSGAGVRNATLTSLMLDASYDGQVNFIPESTPATTTLNADTYTNTVEMFGDADGDGVPDSSFVASAGLTQLANDIAGRAVSATNINPASLDPTSLPNTNVLLWQQFERQAQYIVAAKVLSHGGMVQVSQAQSVQLWNSEFLKGMFYWVRHSSDNGGGQPWPTYLELYDMYGQRGAVEMALRHRGGLLAGADDDDAGGLPPALWNLQGRFRRTFRPSTDDLGERANNWQRFNLADASDWRAWYEAATISADAYDDQYDANNNAYPGARNLYVARQILTTVNNSDELARIQVADPNDPESVPGFYPGKLKYYLGGITDTRKASNNVPYGAFLPDGTFNDQSNLPGVAAAQGFLVVYELQRYFRALLSAYADWSDEAASETDQAFMLAVNTVAFAAPPDATGQVDTVYFTDTNTNKTYIGYAPQPFITEVMAYNDPDPNDPNSTPLVALGIELYNPNDPAAGGDLDLARFAIDIVDPNAAPTTTPFALDTNLAPAPAALFGGRSFFTFALNASSGSLSNTYFQSNLTYTLSGPSVPYSNATDRFTVRLWRRGADTNSLGWYVVDQLTVDPAEVSGTAPGSDWYVDAYRDTSFESSLGVWSGTPAVADPSARWRMVTAFEPNDSNYKITGSNGTPPAGWTDTLGLGLSAATTGTIFGPCTPMYTMNADPNDVVMIHGLARVPSFPTVGFMAFVPRFSHTAVITGTPVSYEPMSSILRDQYVDKKNYGSASCPADFGHMPLFANKQKVSTTIGGFDTTGHVPWGQLVFDYFTTLNPRDGDGDGVDMASDSGDPGLDPYRVPGRVNINTAPWFVLAGLPLLGPGTSGHLPLSSTASPAFWSTQSGILVGTGADGRTPRYPTLVDSSNLTGMGWYRLGPHLAQAAAAYRDRVQYVSAARSALAYAYDRTTTTTTTYYRPQMYGEIRAGAGERGFLSIGELANVMGFDGTDPEDPGSGTFGAGGIGTVLGGYGLEIGGDFMKAASLLALLDTNFVTTRSNTFTIYTTLNDRVNPQSSVRSQVTIDRSNLLPRLVWVDRNTDGIQDRPPTDSYTILEGTGEPELIGQREVSYFGSRYDE